MKHKNMRIKRYKYNSLEGVENTNEGKGKKVFEGGRESGMYGMELKT